MEYTHTYTDTHNALLLKCSVSFLIMWLCNWSHLCYQTKLSVTLHLKCQDPVQQPAYVGAILKCHLIANTFLPTVTRQWEPGNYCTFMFLMYIVHTAWANLHWVDEITLKLYNTTQQCAVRQIRCGFNQFLIKFAVLLSKHLVFQFLFDRTWPVFRNCPSNSGSCLSTLCTCFLVYVALNTFL